MQREYDPQRTGCVQCDHGADRCWPDNDDCLVTRRQQALQSHDQEPFKAPYNPQGVYLSPAESQMVRMAEREAVPLSVLELAAIENGLAAEAYGIGSWADVAEALAIDNVNLPAHYARFKIEPVRFCIENRLNPFQFNIVKYTCREDAKNGQEDKLKVIRYTEMWFDFDAGDPDWWLPRGSPKRRPFNATPA